MSESISQLQAQIPLYINGALQDEERDAFELALKHDLELKQECKEFHEIESVIDGVDQIADQHFDQLFTRIQSNVKLPAAGQGVPASTVEEDSTIIMRQEDIASKSVPGAKSEAAVTKRTDKEIPRENFTDIPKAKTKERPAETPIPKDAQHDSDNEEAISFFSKEHLLDFFTSARLAWGVVIAQFALMITLWVTSTGNGITAIGPDGKAITEIATINVVFADQATQKEIRELLASVDAQIANGPTSIGLYTIYVKGTQEQAKLVIDKLKKSTLILLAEPSFI